MQTDKPATFLDEVPIFRNLTYDARCTLHVAASERIFRRGDVIVNEGDFGDRLYVVAQGSVEVVKQLGKPDEIVLATIPNHSVFGEMCLVEGLVRSASVRALEPSLIYSLTNSALNKFGGFWPEQHTQILSNLAIELSRRLRAMDAVFAARAY